MLRNQLFSLILCSLTLLLGCDKPEPLPIYIQLDTPEIILNSSGTLRSKLGIKDIWMEGNGELRGVFRTPVVVPYIPEGADLLVFSGGIFENGLSAFRSRYPFWNVDIRNLPSNIQPLDTFKPEIQFKYFSDTLLVYAVNETFEGASPEFENVYQGPDQVTLNTTTSGPFSGQSAGRANFTSSQTRLEIASAEFFQLPQSGNNDIYIEITYKNTIPFTAGLNWSAQNLETGRIGPGVFFNSDGEWNTVYLHVNDDVRGLNQQSFFKLYIEANGQGESGYIMLDNIRVVHFR